MKKLITLFAVAALGAALIGCGSKDASTDTATTGTTASSAAPATTTTGTTADAATK